MVHRRQHESRTAALTTSAEQPKQTAMSIYIDSCAARDTIVVNTRSSVYELVVLRGDHGDVLVRGGRHFTDFKRVLFLGSTADDGSLIPRLIDIGLRMKFVSGDRFIITSAVHSLSPGTASAASQECAAVPESRAASVTVLVPAP